MVYEISIGNSNFTVNLYSLYTNDQPRGLILDDFKVIATALNIPYAKYFPTSTRTYIDLFSFCAAHGLKIYMNRNSINITMREDENYV